MSTTSTFKWTGRHPQDLASGAILAHGQTVELTTEDQRQQHNAALIEDGQLLKLTKKDKEGDE